MELYAVPKTKPDILYIGLNDRDPRYHDLYQLRLSTGAKTLLRQNTEQIAGWSFDNAGELRLATRTTPAGDTEILRVDPTGFKTIYTCTVLEDCGDTGFDASNTHAYIITNKGDLNLSELASLDTATGVTTKIESDPLGKVDFGDLITSEVDYRILATQYEDARQRIYPHDAAFERDYRWLKSKVPGMDIAFGARSADENLWIVTAHDDVEPGAVYLWNRAAGTLDLQYRVREELPRDALSSRQPITYTSSDGLEIPAYLTLPKGLDAEESAPRRRSARRPMGARQLGLRHLRRSSSPIAAMRCCSRISAARRATAKAFLNAGNGEWGRKMQDDLTWGVKALVAQGHRRSEAGGHLRRLLWRLRDPGGRRLHPGCLRCGGGLSWRPSNLLTLLDAIPPYWEAGRKQMYTRMADPTTPAGKALLVAESPLTQAKAIKTPLMVVQGANDPRVNVRESNQIVAAVRDNGKPVEYLVAPDEGHGFARPINNLALVTEMEKFFARYLGGRYQPEVPADIAAQLKILVVDPKTVNGTVQLTGALAAKP